MGLADTAKLVVDLSLKGNFASQIATSQKALSGFDKSITNTQGRAYKAGQQIGTGIKRGAVIAAGAIGFLAANVVAGVKSLSDLENVVTQTNAVLASTKGVSGQTATSIRNLATQYEALNAQIDDTVIQSGANLLLTFTAIRKDAFEPALKASLDLSTALHQDLQTSVLQVGKALQDPIKGITALRRAGVNFSADQIKLIKHLVDTGKAAEAQQIILAELTKEFGGSFAKAGQTATGKVAGFRDAIDDLQRLLATAMLPVIGKVADALKKFLNQDSVKKGVTDLGQAIASLFSDDNLAKGADFLKGAFETAKEAAPVVAASAKATFGLVQSAVGLFKSLPPEIQKLAVGAFAVNKLTGGLVTNIAGGIIDVVGKNFLQRGGTPANPLFVADVTGGLGKGIGGALGGAGAAAGGLTAGAVATVGIVAVTFAAGAKSSMDAIGAALGKNNLLAAKGLNEAEIRAVKYFSGTPQYQQEALKHLGSAPSKADFESGLAKLRSQSSAGTVRQIAAIERAESIASHKADSITRAQNRSTIAVRRTEAAENRVARAVQAAKDKIARDTRAAGQATAFAIRDKDLSVAITVPVTVNARVTNRDSSTAQAIANRYYKVPT